ncbi:MAG: TonB family protein [Sphingomonas sp.]
MYADRYARRTKFDPGSMGLALALNGTIVAGLIAFAAPTLVTGIVGPRPPITVIDVAPPKEPPPPEPTAPEVKSQAPTPRATVDVPETIVPTPPSNTNPYTAPTTPPGPVGGTTDGGFVAPVKPTPVVTGAELDSRFAGSFQPEYPVGERRAEHQGRVVVRVLVGVDGRVKQVEKVSAPSNDFFEATERRALQKWRFKPATRDGIPIEVWKTVGVSFVLNDG